MGRRKLKKSTDLKSSSLGGEDTLKNGYWCLSGGQQNLSFQILSAGEVVLLVKSTHQ